MILGLLVLAVLLASLWVDHRTATTLPIPTGTFWVGRAIYDWTDDTSLDALAPVPGTKRELLVWIWYPAEAAPSAKVDDYLPAHMRGAVEEDLGPVLGKLLMRDLSKVQAHSLRDVAVSPRQQSYPVVLMRAGASAEIWNYTTLAEDLASHGYIVVGFDAPYRTHVVAFPDARVMKRAPQNNPELCEGLGEARLAPCVDRVLTAWTSDMAFVLDRLQQLNAADSSGQFKGRLDLARVGVFGHSFGGAAAAQFCHDDSRCKAGINVDGRPFGSVIKEGLHPPFLFLLGDHGHETDPESVQIKADIQSIYDRLPPDGRLLLEIRGANHFLFSDDGALLKSHLAMRTLRMLGFVGIEGRRQLAVTAYCVHRFFDAYLRERSDTPLKMASPDYPEIHPLE